MPTITTTEAGGTGRYINLGAPATHDNVRAQTMIAYCKPTAQGEATLGYLLGKAIPASSSYLRLMHDHNGGAPRLSFASSTTGYSSQPLAYSPADSAPYGSWMHLIGTWDGEPSVANMRTLIDGVDLRDEAAVKSGSVAVGDDAGNPIFLLNRVGLGRSFNGSLAYKAWWNRILTPTEIATAISDGPLSVPSGMLLCWANGQDYGPYGLTPVSRSTFVAGDLPPNTALGGSAGTDGLASGGTGTGTGSGSGGTATGISDGLASGGTGTGTGSGTGGNAYGAGEGVAEGGTGTGVGSGSGGTATGTSGSTLALVSSGDGYNLNTSSSSVTNGATSTPTVVLVPRVQRVYDLGPWVSDQTAWRNVQFSITGALGKAPLFRLNATNYTDTIHGVWRPWYSYDNVTWTQWPSAHTVNGGYREFSGVTFAQDTVYIGFQPGYPLSRITALITELSTNYPDYIHPLRSGNGDWVTETIASQTDELGNTVPAQPFYAFGLWDREAYPDDGKPKRVCVLTNGVHPGETVADWMFEGAVRFLLGSDAKAVALRKNFQFFIYPNINPVGRFGGHWRGQWEPTALIKNANRDYSDYYGQTPFQMQSTRALRDALALDIDGRHLTMHLDFHGQQMDPTGKPVAYWFRHSGMNSTYAANWQTRMRVYNSGYAEQSVNAQSMMQYWLRETYGVEHSYTMEAYEQRVTTAGTADFFTAGEHAIKAVADTFAASPTGEARFVGRYASLDFGNAPTDGPLLASVWSGVPGHNGTLLSADRLGVSGGALVIDASAAETTDVFVLATDEGETAGTTRSFAANVSTSTAT